MTDTRLASVRPRGPHRRPAGTDAVRRAQRSASVTPRTDLDHAVDLLATASSVVLLAHVNPDADALGSALALGLGLRRRGVQVWVSFSEPQAVPESLRELPGQHLVVAAGDLPVGPDLVVTLDVGSCDRLGVAASLLDTAATSLVVDHHASNTRFGRHHLVDTDAEATVVLVTRLLDALGIGIDRDIAANLYAGLATDTVAFRFASASAHLLAARLLDVGVRPAELMRPITDTHPFGWLAMLSTVLGRAVLDRAAAHGAGLVHLAIESADWAHLRQEELDPVIDILRTAKEAAVAAVAKQTGPGEWQVSLRSRDGIDVAAVAGLLGGGGHPRAAGFTHLGEPGVAFAALIEILGR